MDAPEKRLVLKRSINFYVWAHLWFVSSERPRERERERETETETERQRERERDRQTDRQTDRDRKRVLGDLRPVKRTHSDQDQ